MGGGRLKKTVLWTNASPTASAGFVEQNVNLSKSLANYKYIGIKYSLNNIQSYINNATTVYWSVEEYIASSGTPKNHLALTAYNYSENTHYYYFRDTYPNSNTQIHFRPCYRLTPSGTTSSQPLADIPLEIIGLK